MRSNNSILPFFFFEDYNLRQLKLLDSVAYFRYMNNENVKEFLASGLAPNSLEESRRYIDFYANNKGFVWGIAKRTNDLLIGTIGFNFISYVHKKAEIGFDLDYDYWGQKIMKQALEKVVNFAKSINLTRLQATMLEGNARSINLLEKAGFVQEGVLKKYENNSKNQDSKMYSLIFETSGQELQQDNQ